MNKKNRNKIIAQLIIAANKAGVRMESPYDIENLFDDHLRSHQASIDFFYDSEGEPIDAVAESKRILAED